MRTFLLLCLAMGGARAEFLEVRLAVDEIDCATCSQSLQTALRKGRGIKKIQIDESDGAIFTLVPGNKLTLEALRKSIEKMGFTPRGAHVTVKGKALTGDGKWRFAVDGVEKVYTLTTADASTLAALSASKGESITVQARCPAPPDSKTTPAMEVLSLVSAQ